MECTDTISVLYHCYKYTYIVYVLHFYNYQNVFLLCVSLELFLFKYHETAQDNKKSSALKIGKCHRNHDFLTD